MQYPKRPSDAAHAAPVMNGNRPFASSSPLGTFIPKNAAGNCALSNRNGWLDMAVGDASRNDDNNPESLA